MTLMFFCFLVDRKGTLFSVGGLGQNCFFLFSFLSLYVEKHDDDGVVSKKGGGGEGARERREPSKSCGAHSRPHSKRKNIKIFSLSPSSLAPFFSYEKTLIPVPLNR